MKSNPVQLAPRREVRDLAGHLDAAVLTAGDLALAQEANRFAQRQLLARGLIEQAVQLIADRGQPQPASQAVSVPWSGTVISLPRSPARSPPTASSAGGGTASDASGSCASRARSGVP